MFNKSMGIRISMLYQYEMFIRRNQYMIQMIYQYEMYSKQPV